MTCRRKFGIAVVGCWLMAALCAMSVQAQDQAPVRAITHLAGDVYRFQNNQHYSVFMVTPAGVIATDPISPDAAAWLNEQIRQRFNQPVKYVIYSHSDWDHASGADAFGDVIVIAHANAVAPIAASNRPIRLPDITFTNEMVLTLGGKTVQLYYLGVSHTDNLIYMVFPEERVLFAVDTVGINRLPFQDFTGTDIDGVIGSLTALEQMDVDIVAPGHGQVGTLRDVEAHRIYIEDMKDQVTNLLREGKSEQEIKAAVKMPQYSDWESYADWEQMNVDGMIKYVKANYRF